MLKILPCRVGHYPHSPAHAANTEYRWKENPLVMFLRHREGGKQQAHTEHAVLSIRDVPSWSLPCPAQASNEASVLFSWPFFYLTIKLFTIFGFNLACPWSATTKSSTGLIEKQSHSCRTDCATKICHSWNSRFH